MTNRMQRASVEGIFSDFIIVKSWVPHASVLDRLLFILCTSDIWHIIKSDMIAYADDNVLFAHIDHVHSRALAANKLNTDLNLVSDWCKMWGMLINPNKSHSLIVSRSRSLQLPHLPLILNVSVISPISSLGATE